MNRVYSTYIRECMYFTPESGSNPGKDMVRVTKEEALETRNRILDAAETMFQRQGVARTSLADIAAEAKVTRGAVYWHFKNKSDLFNAMCERVRLPMEEMATAGMNDGTVSPLDTLRKVCLFCLRQATGNPHSRAVFGILFHKCEFVDPTDPVYMRQEEAIQLGRKQLETVLGNAVRKGQLPENLDIPLAAAIFQSYMSGLMNHWLFLPDSFDLHAEAERAIDAGIEMLRAGVSLRTAPR